MEGKRILGAVLAGGASRRFGSPKALAYLAGRHLIDHVIERLAGQTEDVIVCGMTHDQRRSVADRPHAGFGPLGGLCAALHLAVAEGFSHVLTSGCDIPQLPPTIVNRLRAAGPAAAVVMEQRTIGLWSASLAGVLSSHLAENGDRSIRGWMRRTGAIEVPLDLPLANVNTPADLAAIQ